VGAMGVIPSGGHHPRSRPSETRVGFAVFACAPGTDITVIPRRRKRMSRPLWENDREHCGGGVTGVPGGEPGVCRSSTRGMNQEVVGGKVPRPTPAADGASLAGRGCRGIVSIDTPQVR